MRGPERNNEGKKEKNAEERRWRKVEEVGENEENLEKDVEGFPPLPTLVHSDSANYFYITTLTLYF